MAVIHLLKPALGCATPRELHERQGVRLFQFEGQDAVWAYTTRRPVRDADLLSGGSLYWVMQNHIACRQVLLGLGEGRFDDGSPYTRLILSPDIIVTHLLPQKSFQGWRYLTPDNAPKDMFTLDTGAEEPPTEMVFELRKLGLL